MAVIEPDGFRFRADGAPAFETEAARAHFVVLQRFCKILDLADQSDDDLDAFLSAAEVRYALFTKLKVKSVLPPWDVAIIYHAHHLTPFRFLADLERLKAPHLSNFPVVELAALIEGDEWSDSESKDAWERTYPGQPYQVLDRYLDESEGPLLCHVPCPYCESIIPARTWVSVRLGTGDAVCASCDKKLLRDTLCRRGLARDISSFVRDPFSPVAAQAIKGAVINTNGQNQAERTTRELRKVSMLRSWEGYEELSWSEWERVQFWAETALPTATAQFLDRLVTAIQNAYESNPLPEFGMDLIAAVKRQRKFAQRITAASHMGLRENMEAAALKYYRFMTLLKGDSGSKLALVPTLDIDLMWHTHQLFSDYYHAWCEEHVGRRINHDDTVGEETLNNSLEETQTAWLAAYGEKYLGALTEPDENKVAASPVMKNPFKPKDRPSRRVDRSSNRDSATFQEAVQYMRPLPSGWESRYTENTQKVYYVNHNDESTSWSHPRIEDLEWADRPGFPRGYENKFYTSFANSEAYGLVQDGDVDYPDLQIPNRIYDPALGWTPALRAQLLRIAGTNDNTQKMMKYFTIMMLQKVYETNNGDSELVLQMQCASLEEFLNIDDNDDEDQKVDETEIILKINRVFEDSRLLGVVNATIKDNVNALLDRLADEKPYVIFDHLIPLKNNLIVGFFQFAILDAWKMGRNPNMSEDEQTAHEKFEASATRQIETLKETHDPLSLPKLLQLFREKFPRASAQLDHDIVHELPYILEEWRRRAERDRLTAEELAKVMAEVQMINERTEAIKAQTALIQRENARRLTEMAEQQRQRQQELERQQERANQVLLQRRRELTQLRQANAMMLQRRRAQQLQAAAMINSAMLGSAASIAGMSFLSTASTMMHVNVGLHINFRLHVNFGLHVDVGLYILQLHNY